MKLSNPVKVLTKARDLIQKKGWIQGDYENKQGFCVMGAIMHVTKDDDHELAERYLYKALPARSRSPISYNDSPSTTKSKIIRFFNRAISLAKLDEA